MLQKLMPRRMPGEERPLLWGSNLPPESPLGEGELVGLCGLIRRLRLRRGVRQEAFSGLNRNLLNV